MKKRLIIFFVIFSSSIFAQSNFELGLKKYNELESDQAIEFFTKSITAKQSLTEAYMMRGAAFIQLGFYDKAITDLEKSITLGSTDHMAFTYMGRAYASKEVHSAAFLCYTKSIELNESYIFHYVDRASCSMLLGDFYGAISDLDTAIKLDSLNAEYYHFRASAKAIILMNEDALKDFDISISLMPTSWSYSGKGQVLHDQGKFEEAIESFNEAFELGEIDRLIFYSRGNCYHELGKHDLACVDFNKSAAMGLDEAILAKEKYCN